VTIAENLRGVRERIRAAALRAGRDPGEILLVGASKTVPPEGIREASAAGLADFGENRLQEARAKRAALEGLAATWHFIGGIQSRKAAEIARTFDFIHSVDRPSLARDLSRAASAAGRAPRVLLEIKLAAEPSKSGCRPEDAPELLREVLALPALDLCGLMAIPPETADPETARAGFRSLRGLRDRLATSGTPGAALRHLSMGMSGDFETAIEEGATIVRIGTAIFGPRAVA